MEGRGAEAAPFLFVQAVYSPYMEVAMTTLILEVEEDVLARAEAAAKASGGDLQSELLSRLQELGSSNRSFQRDVIESMIARANANPHFIEDGMPDREGRNARG
jgi:hypothetical protein